MTPIRSAYQYYLNTYSDYGMNRYDTHKKSQLRAVYNDIVRTNKEAPLYKIRYSGDVGRFAIDIKEKTRSIQNVAASLSDTGGIEHAFSKKIAQSSDENTIAAEYIGQKQDVDDSLYFNVEVRHLATPQINRGNYLQPDWHDIRPGSYSFDLSTNLSSYEFQYSVSGRDTNQNVQDKLIRLINNAGVGLHADLITDDKGAHAIEITSLQTGLSENEQYLFEILPSPDPDSMKAMQVLGISHVEHMASNSSFLLNGTEHSSLSNTFTVNNAFELTLKKESTGSATQIGFKPGSDAIADNVQTLVDAYNNIIQLSHNYSDTQQSSRLLRDMSAVARSHFNELESVGLELSEDGYLSVDRNLLTDAVTSPDSQDCFLLLNDFKNDLNARAARASIDPMNYVDKLLVAYKNPQGHNFATPYITSIYSGMMLDQIC
ncbi:MAG: flagellar capping protein [Roseburia sp.]|jgi:flagellar hook-associated protein 2|nr:flagellar capping protein [Roseburia sp.]